MQAGHGACSHDIQGGGIFVCAAVRPARGGILLVRLGPIRLLIRPPLAYPDDSAELDRGEPEARRLAMHGRLVKGAAVLTLVAVLVSGCETIKRYPKTAIGAVGGATVGGLIAGAAA